MTYEECRRCGTCCRKGGPGLHAQDAPLLRKIGFDALVCLRKGEMVFDQRLGAAKSVGNELVKIRGRGDSWQCWYYDEERGACRIYAYRPLECRVLSCTDPSGLFRAMGTPSLSRKDFVSPDSALMECIVTHDQSFPAEQAVFLARRAVASGAVGAELASLLKTEMVFRRHFAARVEVDDEGLWPYLGRPLWRVLLPFGPMFARFRES